MDMLAKVDETPIELAKDILVEKPAEDSADVKVIYVDKHKQVMKDYYQKRKSTKIHCDVCNVSYSFTNRSHHNNTSKHQKNLIINQLSSKIKSQE
jgi:hypothetical protein